MKFFPHIGLIISEFESSLIIKMKVKLYAKANYQLQKTQMSKKPLIRAKARPYRSPPLISVRRIIIDRRSILPHSSLFSSCPY